ncbi:MAG: septum formation initiator family protein [Syntrophobacterales bacterium]|nr:MAG: septum formation initiator family protein [Syntrophobacterales bacterium]
MGLLKGYKKRILIPLFLFVSVMIFFIFFGDRGLLQVYRLRRELKEIEKVNMELRQENERLRAEIGNLRTNKKYIEELARRELGLVKKGEIVFQFDQ